ncbi:sensor histidine kinase [Deinococcus sp. KNUC1210]|uniref:ATP-binding protein n=1 Tax=Deinococcus sp. KNUC1210 TaxID=2917691 RepID=UPI001EF0160D|nr:sensor histidine kinase [Deinococcus sp. KNUC1210]ULH15208.1 sensor histidine kinase [Deinococcus sp. KNUC1210]
MLRVRDHGPGFQPGDLSRAFERFYRADASRTRHPQHGQSSGLGLAIARALVEAQGGTIEARNHPQGGAEFMLSFPLA